MRLEWSDSGNEVAKLWAAALSSLHIRHPNPDARPVVRIHGTGKPVLSLSVESVRDTRTGAMHERNPLPIASVRLTYFPGARLARQWMAAAWAGYLTHEALELVTIGDSDQRPLDPHAEPYEHNPCNRGLRDGLPRELTPETLRRALAVVMHPADADVLASLGEAR